MKRIFNFYLILQLLFISAVQVQAEVRHTPVVQQTQNCVCNSSVDMSNNQCCSTASLLSFEFERLNALQKLPAFQRAAFFDTKNSVLQHFPSRLFRPPIVLLVS